MTAHFAKTAKKNLGYDPDEVDTLIAKAREVFSQVDSVVDDEGFIRNAQFGLVKGGYEIALVDAALDRLDDAFGLQLARNIVRKQGHDSAREILASSRETLLSRTVRGKGKAFKGSGLLGKGYHRKQVDTMLENISGHLAGTFKLANAQLRDVKFKLVTGGYSEAQVDAYLDHAVDFLNLEQAVANTPNY